MTSEQRDQIKAVLISTAFTAALFASLARTVDWALLDKFFPSEQVTTPVSTEPNIGASLDYVKTLPAYDPVRDAALAYDKTTSANDGVVLVEFVGTAPMRYIVLWQNGRIIGHEVQITDASRQLTVVSPEPESIYSLPLVPVRGLAQANQALTLTLRFESGNATIQTRDIVAGEDGRFNAALQPTTLRSGRYSVTVSAHAMVGVSVTVPIIFSFSK